MLKRRVCHFCGDDQPRLPDNKVQPFCTRQVSHKTASTHLHAFRSSHCDTHALSLRSLLKARTGVPQPHHFRDGRRIVHGLPSPLRLHAARTYSPPDQSGLTSRYPVLLPLAACRIPQETSHRERRRIHHPPPQKTRTSTGSTSISPRTAATTTTSSISGADRMRLRLQRQNTHLTTSVRTLQLALRHNAFAAFRDRLLLSNRIWAQEKQIALMRSDTRASTTPPSSSPVAARALDPPSDPKDRILVPFGRRTNPCARGQDRGSGAGTDGRCRC